MRAMNAKRWMAIMIAIGVMFFSIIIQLISGVQNIADTEVDGFASLFMDGGGIQTHTITPGSPGEQIVVLSVNGAIIDSGSTSLFDTQTFQFRLFMEMLDIIENDDTIAGVVLYVNSPGGGVYESAQIRRRLDHIQSERGIPLYASFGSMAASGGYYISSGADQIFAPKETLTGSIGVIFSALNVAGLFEEFGIEAMTVTSGEHKDILSPYREMTDVERDILQSMVDNSYDGFVRVIAQGRGMSESHVRSFADGRIVDGIQAKELGLIDAHGYLEDAIAALKADYDLGNAQVIHFQAAPAFPLIFGMNLEGILPSNPSSVDQIARALDTNTAPRLMYILPSMVY